MRLQEYGVGIFEATATRSALKKLLKKEYITVDGIKASTATMIKGGETINLSLPDPLKPGKPVELSLKVLFEDEYLAAVSKPAGIAVSGNKFRTIVNALPFNLKISARRDACIPQPVHRLDFPTTGILLVGKTAGCVRSLNRMFEDRKIRKTYYAITMGNMADLKSINEPVEGKSALTELKVVDRVPSDKYGRLNLVQLHPATGRRHQLRIHLAAVGHPILGDKKYGSGSHGSKLYLHAASIVFNHPVTGEMLCIEDKLPRHFRKIFSLPE